MQNSKVRSRLKAQLSKFSSQLCVGLSKPLAKFTSQMLFGIQASQDVKLSNISRALQEEIALIKTETRLSRNLKSAQLESELSRQLIRMGSQRVEQNTVLALDLSDIRKEYARKMENLDLVHDGSTGQVHEGYWLCDVTAAPVNGSEIVPLYQKLYSARAADFRSENAELLAAIDAVRTHTEERGVWAMDRGGRPQKAAGAVAGAEAALRDPLHRPAVCDRPPESFRGSGEAGQPVSPAPSGSHHQN